VTSTRSRWGGRVFTFFILIIGLGTVAIPSGLFASALGKAREEIQG
jgi:voltage-gated potassium channel